LINKIFQIRPSVSLVPIENNRFDFFISNTRKSIKLLIEDSNILAILYNLNGIKPLNEILISNNIEFTEKIEFFIKYLLDKSIIEDKEIANKIENNPFRRVLNFLADFVTCYELFDIWENIQKSHICIFGVGAMGSWISQLLIQSGILNITLIDSDIVSISNLNRSLFFSEDIGKLKITAVKESLENIHKNINIFCINELIENKNQVDNILKSINSSNIVVINCADFPNVDTTSEIICKSCMELEIPHIIAGGYNLHLSLIGPTIIPYKTACYYCIKTYLESLNDDNNLKFLKKLQRKQRNIGSLASLVGISASFVVNEVIKITSKSSKIEPFMTNKRGEYNFITNQTHFTEINRKNDCIWCSSKK